MPTEAMTEAVTMEKANEFWSGCLPSPEDERDYPCSAAMEIDETEENFPREFEVWTSPVENQGTTGNCVAQALAAIVESEYHRLNSASEEYSVGYIYGNRRKDGIPKSSGMYPRSACEAMIDYGDVTKSVFECTDEVPDVINAFEKAYDSIKDEAWCPFGEYVRIRKKDDYKRFLLKYKIPTLIRIDAKTISPMTSGNHAVIAYGWDWDGAIKIQNSWGKRCDKILITWDDIEEMWGLVPMKKEFTDVSKEAWYAEAVEEAAFDGIINGYPDGTFKPEKAVTRAELAAIYSRMKKALKS